MLFLLPFTMAEVSPPEDVGVPQPGASSPVSTTAVTSPYFGGYETDGGDSVSAVITVPEIPCGAVDTGVFPSLGIRDFGSYVVYSGVFAVCQAGQTHYSAALYAPGVERHLDRLLVRPGDQMRVKYQASKINGRVSIENLTRGWRRHEDGFGKPDAFRTELGDFSVSIGDSSLPIPDFGHHSFRHARVDTRLVDDDISEKVIFMDSSGRVWIDSFVAVDGRFTLWSEDPDLAAGFPVSIRDPHVYQAGVRINATAANIDDDAELEVCGTGLGPAPAACWNPDGSLVDGWRASGSVDRSAQYVSVGSLEPALSTAVVMTSTFSMTAVDGNHHRVEGWPREKRQTDVAPTLATSIDGSAMVVIGTEDGLDVLDAAGNSLPGWPVEITSGGYGFHTPAVSDVDGLPGVEIFSVGSGSDAIYAYHEDGSPVAGYPVQFSALVYTYPALGDVDGDGAIELVVVGSAEDDPYNATLFVFDAATGSLHGSHPLSSRGSQGVVALANLDQTCGPGAPLSMIVQTNLTLEATTWNGETFADQPGFPVVWGEGYWSSNSAPAVGDLNGDGTPDIAITGQVAGTDGGTVFAYDANGELLRRFPKDLPLDGGGGPAIADIDLDGRNELVIKGSKRGDGWVPSLWVYDLGGGPSQPPEWGQFMNTSDHRSAYVSPAC